MALLSRIFSIFSLFFSLIITSFRVWTKTDTRKGTWRDIVNALEKKCSMTFHNFVSSSLCSPLWATLLTLESHLFISIWNHVWILVVFIAIDFTYISCREGFCNFLFFIVESSRKSWKYIDYLFALCYNQTHCLLLFISRYLKFNESVFSLKT